MLRPIVATYICALLCHFSASAQITVGVKGSLQLAKFVYSASNQQTSNLIGFQAGLMVNAPITDQLSIRSQLLYSTKRVKTGSISQSVGLDIKLALNYLEIPIQLAYAFEAGEGRVVVGAGPYLGYGLSSVLTATSTYNGQKSTDRE